MINIKNLNKTFGKKCVLKDVNLTFEIGKMYGILGRNGVGKTTLLKIINRRFNLTSGEINYNDLLVNNQLDISGVYMSTDLLYYSTGFTTPKKIIDIIKKINPKFDLEYAYILLEKFNIELNKRYSVFTQSQTQIIANIFTLASNKTILIFDEPIQNIELQYRNLFYKELLNLYMKETHIILISSHIITEIENIISDVVIIKDNIIVANEEVETLKEKYNNISLEDIFIKKVGEENEK